MADIGELRKKIDDVDDNILELLNRRAELVKEVGKVKVQGNTDFYVPTREKEIYDRLMKNNKGHFPNESIRAIFREIISASLSLEHPLKIAFFGPQATYTHLASLKQFGHSADLIPVTSIAEVFEEVEKGGANYGVVPIENSTEGIVTHTLDMFVDSNLQIVAEVMLEISDIKKVYSHPQPIAQCRNWLAKNLPNIPVMETASTAAAAQMVANDPEAAAIASEFAASIYDLKVVKKRIEDNVNNFTRFLVIGKKSPDKSGSDKTSVMFAVKDEAGALCRMLEPFSRHNINLAKIESRPMKTRAWEYLFFLDMDGHISEPHVKDAIDELSKICLFVKVLGSYPRNKG
ncbi:MAG: chorismate mutase [Deltaproteobacteria bacterium]|nr:chorismate mutase [Deltaproteobacteria bacterium]